jgi:hypothetical protein
MTLPPLWAGVTMAPHSGAAARLAVVVPGALLGGCRLRVEGLEPAGRGFGRPRGQSRELRRRRRSRAPEACAVAKRELGAIPVVGTVIRKVGHLVVARADPSRSVADAAWPARCAPGPSFSCSPRAPSAARPDCRRSGSARSGCGGRLSPGGPGRGPGHPARRRPTPGSRGRTDHHDGIPIAPEGAAGRNGATADRVRAAIARATGEAPLEPVAQTACRHISACESWRRRSGRGRAHKRRR